MTESSVRVGVRVRPLVPREKGQGITIDSYDSQSLIFKGQTFTFDHVFGSELSQNELYDRTAAPMLKSFLEGYNCTIMAYGQTGSGKTFTMGTADHTCHDPEVQGLIPRFVMDLFENLNNPLSKDEETSFKLRVSFLEIYGEDVFDLLNASARQTDLNARTSLAVREDENGRVFVQGQTDVEVKSPLNTLEVLALGSQNRVTAATAMNAGSSRSHAVFTITLEQSVKSAGGADEDVHCMTSKLTFVDLAGSERIKRTGAEGQRMKEGIQINSGLFNLGQVINSLADDQKLKSGAKTFVPYRNSKLTHLLKDALGGNSQTLFLACVSPADSNDNETYSTLNYARQARNIQNKPIRNMDKTQLEIRKLRLSMKTWMLKAIELQFGASLTATQSKGEAPGFRSPTRGLLSPAASTFDVSCKSSASLASSASFSYEEELFRRPEVIEFVNAVNASILGKLDGLSAPTPRKIRVSTGVPVLPGKNKMFSPGFSSPSSGKQKKTCDADADYFPSLGMPAAYEDQPLPMRNGRGRESVLCTAGLSGAIEAANQIEDSEHLVERMIDMVNKEKKLLGVQSTNDTESAAADTATAAAEETTEEILEVDRLIEEKEEILNKLLDNIKGYSVLKSEFEKLVDAINNLEEEKKELESELERAKRSSTNGVGPVHSSANIEKMNERFAVVKKELEKMREDRNKKEHAYRVMQRESKQCEAMQRELQKLKEAKVTLMRQQRSQYQQLQKLKKESAAKISVFKKNDVKKQQQVNSLKDEVKKKERILSLKEKELGRVSMKLKACEDHIAQLLKLQSRARNTKIPSAGSSSNLNANASSGASSLANNAAGSARVSLKIAALEKFRGQLDNAEFDHLATSKGLLEQCVLTSVERRITADCYAKKTAQLKKLNADLAIETAKLENLLAVKASILDEYKENNKENNNNSNNKESNEEEEEVVNLDALPIEVKYKLEAVQTDILFGEDVIDEISREIDDCNIDLDELSLRLEEFGSPSTNAREKDEAESNWDSIGRDVVSGLSLSQSQVLLVDLLSDKASLLEKARTLERDYKKVRTDCDNASDKVQKYQMHLEKLREDFHDRLAKTERQKIHDVWAILKAHQSDSQAALAHSEVAAEIAQNVAIQRAVDLEKELNVLVSQEETLSSALTEKERELLLFRTKCEQLETSLNVQKRLFSSQSPSASSSSASVLSEEYVNTLTRFWDEMGTPGEDRQSTLDYLLKCNQIAQERALKDAHDGLHAATNELKQTHEYVVSFCAMLDIPLSSLSSLSSPALQRKHTAINEEEQAREREEEARKELQLLLHDMPKLTALNKLHVTLEEVLERVFAVVPRLVSLKENLLTLVAEMWLEIHELPRSLQTLHALKLDTLVPLIGENGPECESMREIKCLEVQKIAKIFMERGASCKDISMWESEVKRLNLQRVQVTNSLISLRDHIMSTMQDLEIIKKEEIQTLLSSALQSPAISSSLAASPSTSARLGAELAVPLSPKAVRTAVEVLSMRSASNPPGSAKLQVALERVKLLLDSVKCNRHAVAAQLKSFIDCFATSFGESDVLASLTAVLPAAKESKDLVFKNSALDTLFSVAESVSMRLNRQRFQTAMQIKMVLKQLSYATPEDKLMDQIYNFLQKKVRDFTAASAVGSVSQSDTLPAGWQLARTSDEVTEELSSMSMFLEESWIQTRINEIAKSWSSFACDDLEVRGASSPISLKILAVETAALKQELKRLETIQEAFSELKSTDAQLIKHVLELEEFESSSKENRAKALSGNSKLLIEEEKYRRNAKKKFENITDKMQQLYAKLVSISNAAIAACDGSIEVKIDISGLSPQGQALLKGQLTKEKLELMRLNTLTAAGADNANRGSSAAANANGAAPLSTAATVNSAAAAASAAAAGGVAGVKRRLSADKEEKSYKKEAREPITKSSVSAIASKVTRPGFTRPTAATKSGSFKGSAPLSIASSAASSFDSSDNVSPTISIPAQNPFGDMPLPSSPKNSFKSKRVSTLTSLSAAPSFDENEVNNKISIMKGGPSDEEIHAALMADGMFPPGI